MSAHINGITELIQNPSFNRWAKGEASEEEKLLWDRWVMESPKNRALAMEAQEEIEGFSIRPGERASTDEGWNEIQRCIERIEKEIRAEKLFTHASRKSDHLKWVFRTAAVFMLVAVTGFFVFQLHQNSGEGAGEKIRKEVHTKIGEQKTITFSDGSEVILNGGSNIIYTVDTNKPDAIDLYLEGEAYFSISSRTTPGSSPFRVRTDQGTVSVMGTRFVVSTHTRQTRVVLEEGRVAVQPSRLEKETILRPGQLGELHGQNSFVETRSVNIEVYTSWIHGRLAFEQASVEEVMERLENTFGVRIEILDSKVFQQKISGSIENSELEIITSALAKMLNTSIHKSDSGDVIYVGEGAKGDSKSTRTD